MSTRDRMESLRGLAHIIARRFQAVRENGKATPELLAHHFDLLTKHSDHMRGGSVTTAEMEKLAAELVPEAVEFLAGRLQVAA
jgi:hypothetical protein